jgi:lipoyl(octanoyl) transferase
MPQPPLQLRYIRELQDYLPLYEAMKAFTQNRNPAQADEIWFCQHRPVFTKGLATKPEHLFETGHIPVIQTDRGGQVTYHGPGQLMAYLLIDHARAKIGARALVTLIEQSLVALLSKLGIQANADPEAPGVYTPQGKIAALGLKIARKGSYHGLCLNIDANLLPFNRINPCGVEKAPIAQLADLLAAEQMPPMETLAKQLGEQLCSRLHQTFEWHSQAHLDH